MTQSLVLPGIYVLNDFKVHLKDVKCSNYNLSFTS